MATYRRVGTSSAATLFVMALSSGLAAWIAPEWIETAGLDVWELPALRKQMEELNEKELIMNAQFEDTHARMAMKEHLIDNVLAGRATLKMATSELTALHQNHPAVLSSIRAAYKGATDEENFARNVIESVETRVWGSANQKSVVLWKLESELKQMISDNHSISR